jgi:hypothetical protein
MATIPIATIIPGPKYTLSALAATQANGLFMLGNADPENSQVGSYCIDFRMSPDWVGTIGVLGRNAAHKAGVDDIALIGPWPFRAFYLNGVGYDGSMVSGVAALVTSTSSILVPASGYTIGLGVSCTAGFCTMYYLPLLGQSAV